jgi:hypothetical protein
MNLVDPNPGARRPSRSFQRCAFCDHFVATVACSSGGDDNKSPAGVITCEWDDVLVSRAA